MTHSHLTSFIEHARGKGMDHQTIRMLLLSAGWKERDISQALASESLDQPIPMPPDAGSARDAFFHLLSFTSLTATVVSLTFLVMEYLDRLFPDPAFPEYMYDSGLSSIRWQLAVVFVSFPLFLWMQRLLRREYASNPEKLGSGVRRWLTYLILFATACTLVGDLIALIFSLLEGEITVRFILKVLAVLVLAGLPFDYYLRTLRMSPDGFTRSGVHTRFLWISVAIVVASIIAGFVITGSPLYGRAERFDEQRVSDLRAIQSEIFTIAWGSALNAPTRPATPENPIPANLEEAASKAQYQKLNITDPETGTPYVYRVTSETAYQLCAVFSLSRDQQFDIFWNHPAGEHCFSFDVKDQQVR